ncbi:MAG: ATP-binding protein [Sciscionella sp.]
MVNSERGEGFTAGCPVSARPVAEAGVSGRAVVTARGERDFSEARFGREALLSSRGAAEADGIGTVPYRRRVALLPSSDRAAGIARAVVRSVCVRWGLDATAELAVFCVSELATNAARHVEWGQVPLGERVAWLVVELWGPLLVVEVRDPSRVLPAVGVEIDWSSFEAAAGDVLLLPESGLGLRVVVERLRQVGGVFGSGVLPLGGKAVFFGVPWGARR